MRAQMFDDPITTENAIRSNSCDVGITRNKNETWIFYQEHLLDEIFNRITRTLKERCIFKPVAPHSAIMFSTVTSSVDAVLDAMKK